MLGPQRLDRGQRWNTPESRHETRGVGSDQRGQERRVSGHLDQRILHRGDRYAVDSGHRNLGASGDGHHASATGAVRPVRHYVHLRRPGAHDGQAEQGEHRESVPPRLALGL